MNDSAPPACDANATPPAYSKREASGDAPAIVNERYLRTLVPALRQLERRLRAWLDGPHGFPLTTMNRAALEGEANDLRRQAEALDVDRPLLIIMLMGGTGVGKSTLLNALAGGAIAEASFARPTTRDPVVYYHESLKPDRLDPVLRQCRLAPHNRPALEQKILVDTPDLDSNDLANRDKLMQLLPVADVVLYVGSQEKYHDKLGWDLFLRQRCRRAFAFVLNKWDRCLQTAPSGLRPDEDLLRDLNSEGFQNPLLFRTCARLWVEPGSDGAKDGVLQSPNGASAATEHSPVAATGAANPMPEGEQFPELVQWLEMGLTRLEIEAIKARGITQLLHHVESALTSACPPDLVAQAAKVADAWDHILAEEAGDDTAVLLNTLEPYQKEIEHHFALEGQRRFHGLMALYLRLFTRTRYVGSTLRDRVRILPRPTRVVETPATWDLYSFTAACSRAAGERHLDARSRALSNRLQVEADREGFPVELLHEPTEAASKIDWRQRHSQIMVEVLGEIEKQRSKPTGARRWLQGTVIWLANQLPLIALVAVCILLLWQFTVGQRSFQLGDLLLPVVVVFLVLVVLHVIITLVLPLRWPAIRGDFERRLERRLRAELQKTFLPIPTDVADMLTRERRQVEQLRAEAGEVVSWVEQRERAANITGLYGN